MRFISLFTGFGGMDLGLERAGLQCIYQVENDPYAERILRQNWPNVPKHGDIHTFPGDAPPDADLICGGDPCQENSNSQRSGDCTSPSLGGEFIRVVDVLRPRLVLRENPSVVKKTAPWPWWRFRESLERLGYAVLPFRLRACCTGADFRRERLFLLAELQGTECQRLEGYVRQVVEGENEGGQDTHPAGPDRWSATPRVCGRTVRIPNRKQRLKGIGNAVVPRVAETIGRILMRAESLRIGSTE